MTIFITCFPLADIIAAIKGSNVAGQAILGVLFVGSIIAWSIMVSKAVELKQSRFESDRFLAMYGKETNPASLYLKRQKYQRN